MEVIKFEIEGLSPLLMHSDRLVDPLDPDTKAMKAITSKKQKTDQDHLDLRYMDFCGGIYFDELVGPYMPGINIRACMQAAARLNKQGKKIGRGVIIPELMVPVEYKGPRTIEGLFKKGFWDCRPVVVNKSKLMRTRPKFDKWKMTFTVNFSDEIVDGPELRDILERAGNFIGLGDFRPDRDGPFGRFKVLK